MISATHRRGCSNATGSGVPGSLAMPTGVVFTTRAAFASTGSSGLSAVFVLPAHSRVWSWGAQLRQSARQMLGMVLDLLDVQKFEDARVVPDAAKIGPPVSLTSFPGHAAWIDGSWKLHRIEKKGAAEVEWELYNLATDPNEADILIAEQPERFASMRNALEDWLESVAKSLNGEDYKQP